MLLSRIYKDHVTRQNKLREKCDEQRRIALNSVGETSNSMLESLNKDVEKVFENQRKLEVHAKELQIQSQKFNKQTQSWLNLINNFNRALKELGDVENWAEVIENEIRDISNTLEFVYTGIEK